MGFDATDSSEIKVVVCFAGLAQLYFFAAIVFSGGVDNAVFTFALDLTRLFGVLDGFGYSLFGVFCFSFIAVFGSASAGLFPALFGGVVAAIVFGFLRLGVGAWCLYYAPFFYVDVRGLGSAGLLSYFGLAGGGLTFFAVFIFFLAIAPEVYIFFFSWSPRVWMMYIGDALGGSLNVVYSPVSAIYFVTSFDVLGLGFMLLDVFALLNEPLPALDISCLLVFGEALADFLPNRLGAFFAETDFQCALIFCVDHVARAVLAIFIFDASDSAAYLDVSGFHLFVVWVFFLFVLY
ncbi:hypothetical protein SAMN05660776_2583 [Salegentibacter holothuriorum]|uniref:Uncharacterized protein n=1 Tax=Salegentibacter holothuriorum TaxID=241145 RepID=A0A1T5DFC7_9FLAO|nr:hypothetical protein [Salegentibacter holothuriorum]SKB70233.1 hypothetical protein SAMN05660776_2583 [Salegentibacter holothuriorum]